MLSAKELREKRAPHATKIKDLTEKVIGENRDFNADEQKDYDAANKDYDALTKQIEKVERAERVAAEQTAPANHGESRQQLPGRENRDARQEDEERRSREDDESLAGDDGGSVDDWRTVGESGPATRLVGGTAEQQALCLQGWMRCQQGYDLTKRHAAAMKSCQVNPRAKYLDIPLTRKVAGFQKRALSGVVGAAGAYTIPEGFGPSFELAMLQFGGIRQVAQIMRTATGNPMPWPTANDTSNKGARVGENTAVATNVDPTFGSIIFNAYKYTSKVILVPVELLEDTAFDLPTVIGGMCGERIGRAQADDFTTGTAAAQPNGIVTAIDSTATKTTASATAITYAEIIDLVHKVDPAYRSNPAVGFMFHDLILAYLSKLADGQGRPIWDTAQQQLTDNQGQGSLRIAGRNYPYTINQSMDSTVATGKKTMLFGDFSKYKIRDVASVRLRRLVERYADSDQEGFVAFARSDGNLLDAGTHPVALLKQL